MMTYQQQSEQLRIERNQNGFVVDHDGTGPISAVLIEAVASLRDVDETELAPLYDCVDPEALDSLCDSDSALRISFQYGGYAVTVQGSDRLRLVELDEKQ